MRGQQIRLDEDDFRLYEIELIGLGLHAVVGVGKAGAGLALESGEETQE